MATRKNPTKKRIGLHLPWVKIGLISTGLALAFLASFTAWPKLMGDKAGSPTADTAVSSKKPLGMAVGNDFAYLSDLELAAWISDLKSMGVKWVRYDIDWDIVQRKGADHYDWSRYDRVVESLRAANISSLAILAYTPPWARDPACLDTYRCKPHNNDDYVRFAGMAVDRYKVKGVHAWEIWNEPNLEQFWKPAPNAADYTRLLKAASAKIKQRDPNAKVLNGGLGRNNPARRDIAPTSFLNSMYSLGAGKSFDAVSVHPYSFPYLPTDREQGTLWQKMGATLPSLRSIMMANGDVNKKIWVTEFGAPTGGPIPLAADSGPKHGMGDPVTEHLQLQLMTSAVSAWRSYYWASVFMWYSYKDNGTDSSSVEDFYGLYRADGTAKPGYYKYRELLEANK